VVGKAKHSCLIGEHTALLEKYAPYHAEFGVPRPALGAGTMILPGEAIGPRQAMDSKNQPTSEKNWHDEQPAVSFAWRLSLCHRV
jgi:hypothetical protein